MTQKRHLVYWKF